MRVERFLTKIAGKEILNYDNFLQNKSEAPISISSLDSALEKTSNARRGNKPN
jgi:hypothetical protein